MAATLIGDNRLQFGIPEVRHGLYVFMGFLEGAKIRLRFSPEDVVSAIVRHAGLRITQKWIVRVTDDGVVTPYVLQEEWVMGKLHNRANQLTVAVHHCQSCGDKHFDQPFYPIQKANALYNHWSVCPTTGEPIFSFIDTTQHRPI